MTQSAIATWGKDALSERADAARKSATKYRPDVDGLRAVAIASVFVFHANHALLMPGVSDEFFPH